MPHLRLAVPRSRPRHGLLLVLAFTSAVLAMPDGALASTRIQGGAQFPALERFAMSLLNCTRTGGWVQANGTCKGRGSGRYSRYRKPLKLSGGLSSGASRPYAARLARAHACSHDLGSTALARIHAAGFKGTTWGESIGCGGGWTTREMIISTHRGYQAEKGTPGWHWRNLKNPQFDRVGIGVRKIDGQDRIVYDFWAP